MNKSKVGLTLLSVLIICASAIICFGNTQAQTTATVTILEGTGGSTTPDAGTYQYNDGETVTITATATTSGVSFSYWLITVDTETRQTPTYPLEFPVSAGVNYTIQPVFDFLQGLNGKPAPTDLSNAAIVIIMPASGGTTSPAPGKYAFTNADKLNITAMPDNGWKFSHWVILGADTSNHGDAPTNLQPTDNPYNVNHGYGATYAYQAVFTETSSPSPSVPEFPILAVLMLLAVAAPLVALAKKHMTIKLQ